MQKNYSGRMSLADWTSFFIEFIVPDDLSEEIAESFLRHLTDLGALVPLDGDIWRWSGCDSQINSKSLLAKVQKDIESLSDSESGFALAYFIRYKNLNKKSLVAGSDSFDSDNVDRKDGEPSSAVKPASDLSNLQIVKKVGKQLQPFLQIEEAIVARLVGKYAGKQDAQRLFHYMFGKVGSKAEPQVWEQLSRKRHR